MKEKWLSDEALQIAVKRKDVKGKGEKKRYTHLNAEFQRIARRDKKAFLSDQCKEIEGNNRMGKTRDLFKKIRDTKETFHAKMDTVKGQKRYGPKRSRRYSEEVARIQKNDTKNIYMTQITAMLRSLT